MTLILAKIFGLYFLGVGLAFFFNPNRIGGIYDLMMKNEGILFLGGIIALLFGAFVVSVHNIWVFDWPVILTIIGWWSLIKGFLILAWQGFAPSFSFMLNRPDSFYRGLGAVAALIGLFLSYQGWK